VGGKNTYWNVLLKGSIQIGSAGNKIQNKVFCRGWENRPNGLHALQGWVTPSMKGSGPRKKGERRRSRSTNYKSTQTKTVKVQTTGGLGTTGTHKRRDSNKKLASPGKQGGNFGEQAQGEPENLRERGEHKKQKKNQKKLKHGILRNWGLLGKRKKPMEKTVRLNLGYWGKRPIYYRGERQKIPGRGGTPELYTEGTAKLKRKAAKTRKFQSQIERGRRGTNKKRGGVTPTHS